MRTLVKFRQVQKHFENPKVTTERYAERYQGKIWWIKNNIRLFF